MKLHFEPDLDYQLQAIEAVCDLFQGQEVNQTEFTVSNQSAHGQQALGLVETTRGVGNRLALLDDEILANLNAVQIRNGLRPSATLASGDFTVEMETGTGKTYVYLRTVFELNRRYGFTKFVVVVPSVAIKEGVYKSLQITADHFRQLYAGVPFHYSLYDSTRPEQVRTFATSASIEVMVMTVQSIVRKDYAVVYKETEKMNGERPIDLIRATNPILIVDEPQSVDGGLTGKGKQALDEMNPLCTLRYSATHANKHHMVFRLDAVDAYQRQLVKQIEVASATVENAHNRPYVRLLSVKSTRGTVEARVEIDKVAAGGKVSRKEVTVQDGDDLEQASGGRAVYADCRIGEISARKDDTFVELRIPGGDVLLASGEAYGDVDAEAVARQMIHRTIKEHLDKEKRLRPKGIKVLSLFFLDRVDRYRATDAAGNPEKGVYARIFEEEYTRLAGRSTYRQLFEGVDLSAAASDVHEGYFSVDKKGVASEPDLNADGEIKNQASRDDAERAYTLIMKDKERLLSFETPLKFIFSHSALREGWDNPNVFQICTLRDMRTERQRRQTIGRGLRLCVDQTGQRVRGFEVNTLTVIATESYESFAEGLQKEIEADTGIRFGVVEPHQFAGVTVVQADGSEASMGIAASEALWDHLVGTGYIDARGRVQDALRTALKDDVVVLPEINEPQRAPIVDILRKLAGKLDVKKAEDRRTVAIRSAVLDSPEFQALWDRIKHKTTYRVDFDPARLIRDAARAFREGPPIARTRINWNVAGLSIGKAGVEATKLREAAPATLNEADVPLPDLLTELQDRTQLTRRSIVEILTESGRLDQFRHNPQQFIELAAEAVNRTKRAALVDGIVYKPVGDGAYYAQRLFADPELTGYIGNMIEDETGKSVYEQVVYDSGTERTFAEHLQANEAVKVFAKLPGWFTVPTPLGTYNPDWAVVIEEDGEDRVYLVVETKSTLFEDEMRDRETAKIKAGRRHFGALKASEPPVRYEVADNLQTIFDTLHAGD